MIVRMLAGCLLGGVALAFAHNSLGVGPWAMFVASSLVVAVIGYVTVDPAVKRGELNHPKR